ncbi:Proto-oncogene tyrosine-protein kinase ROS, partial [Camponotus floridanus]
KSLESKPTSLRAFVQFDSQFTQKVNDIFVTLSWNQPEFTEILQGYTVQCFFIEDLKEIQTCDDKNITTTKLEHTVHNLSSNTTYYFRVRAHTKIVAGPYTDLINVSTTHQNPIPKLLFTSSKGIRILDVDSNITYCVTSELVRYVAYSIQEHRIYWLTERDLMTLKINENNFTKIASFDNYSYNPCIENNFTKIVSFDNHPYNLCIDWIARNLYFTYAESPSYIVKFDLAMWENGIIKFDKIFESKVYYDYLNVSPSMGILYYVSYNSNTEYRMMKYHLNGKIEQIVEINVCLYNYINYINFPMSNMIIDNMNNEELLIYWLNEDYIFVTDINISMCNTILHKKYPSNNIFKSMAIDKTYIYISASDNSSQFILYVLKKKYAGLKSINADDHVEKIIISSDKNMIHKIYAFDKSLQPYPLIRCLTPYEKVYNFENVNATANSIIINLPEPVVKSGCKKYNLPTTIYTISVSCLDNNLNKSEKFNVLTAERYYEIQNLTPFTEYNLKFTISNFYFDQLSINPLDSNVIRIKTNWGKLNAPENISGLGLTPTIAVVHWMPPKKVNCVAVTYEVHWKSVTLMNETQQRDKQFINMPKCMVDGRFFTKINLSLSVQDYLIYVRVYPINISDFYNESLNEIVHIFSEPNNITSSEVDINSMNISWISNINLTIFFTLEYKDIAAKKWQKMNYIKMNYINYNNEVIYHVENLKSGTSYKFRLILSYIEYEETFIWPADERFIFSTRG